MSLVIIDTGGANLASIGNAVTRIGHNFKVSTDRSDIRAASHIILPGVSAASPIINHLESLALINFIKDLEQPLLGICLGMQILFKHTEEGEIDCIGILGDTIKKFPEQPNISIPHMGWNEINMTDDPLFSGIDQGSYVYFAHSYYASMSGYTISSTHHGVSFSSAIRYKNFYGVQFHPEKSGSVGEQILNNFLKT
jgi:glutamine amidotransferase